MLNTSKYTPRIVDFIDYDELPVNLRRIVQSLASDCDNLLDYCDGDYYFKFSLNPDLYTKDNDEAKLFKYLQENLPDDVLKTNKFGIYVYQ